MNLKFDCADRYCNNRITKNKVSQAGFSIQKTSCFCIPRIRSILIQADILFPFSFQFFSRLAAVFAEEVGGFGMVPLDGSI